MAVLFFFAQFIWIALLSGVEIFKEKPLAGGTCRFGHCGITEALIFFCILLISTIVYLVFLHRGSFFKSIKQKFKFFFLLSTFNIFFYLFILQIYQLMF